MWIDSSLTFHVSIISNIFSDSLCFVMKLMVMVAFLVLLVQGNRDYRFNEISLIDFLDLLAFLVSTLLDQ